MAGSSYEVAERARPVIMTKAQRTIFVLLLAGAVLLNASQWWLSRQHAAQWTQLKADGFGSPAVAAAPAQSTATADDSSSAPEQDEAGAPATAAMELHCEKVHVNYASSETLQTLPGIGPAYAANIIKEREKALFVYPEELLRVRGIGPVRLEAIRQLVCMEPEILSDEAN